jgi:hypothetical protein
MSPALVRSLHRVADDYSSFAEVFSSRNAKTRIVITRDQTEMLSPLSSLSSSSKEGQNYFHDYHIPYRWSAAHSSAII